MWKREWAGKVLRGYAKSEPGAVATGSVRLEIARRLLTRYQQKLGRFNMNYAIGVATQYSTASEATGCRHSVIARTLETVVECRHPVASLAVLYWGAESNRIIPAESLSFYPPAGSE